eukprot:1159315-Pelagomonas_calceolata.AAC.3
MPFRPCPWSPPSAPSSSSLSSVPPPPEGPTCSKVTRVLSCARTQACKSMQLLTRVETAVIATGACLCEYT